MKNNNNISLAVLFTVVVLNGFSGAKAVAGSTIDHVDKAVAACKELSEESLSEMGLAPHSWRAETNNQSNGFSVEGSWQTKNGKYIVECEIGFGKSFDDVDVNITKI